MTTKTKVLLSILALLTAFGFGRFSGPEKIKEVVKTVEVEKKVTFTNTDTDRDKNKTIVTTEVTRPDGTKEKTTTVTENSKTTRKTGTETTDQRTTTKDEEKTTTYASGRLTVSFLASVPIGSSQKQVFGVAATQPVAGPITVGLFGLTNGTIGGSLGLTF